MRGVASLKCAICSGSELAKGADLFMNMETYNAGSYEEWLQYLGPAVTDPSIPRSKLGAGLGCWIESTVPAWSLTPQSAQQRVCELMNRSVVEIDMFRLNPPQWPQPWWVPELSKFMDGGGCEPAPPHKTDCPATGWVVCDPADCSGASGCCTLLEAAINTTGCSHPDNKTACAEQQCKESSTKVNSWVPRDYSHHPFTCCPE